MSQIKPASDLPFRDIPEIAEAYADGIEAVVVNSRTVHVTLTVNRAEKTIPPAPTRGYRVPSARLVLDGNCVVELHAKLTRVIELMAGAGTHGGTVQ